MQNYSLKFKNFLDQSIRCGLYLSLLLPLGFTGWTRFPAHFGKTVLFQMLVELLALLYLFRNWKLEIGNWKLNKIDYSILFFLAILVITSLTGVNPANSFWGNASRAQGVFTWLHFGAWFFLFTRLNFSNKNFGGQALIITNLVAFLVTLTALFQPWLKFSFITDQQADRLSGLFGNPAFLASYLLLAATIAFYTYAIKPKIGNWKLEIGNYFLALGFLELFTLYRTGTRGALIGLTVGLLAGLAFFVSSYKVSYSLQYKTKFFGGLVLVFLVGFSVFKFFGFQIPNTLPATAQTRLMAWEIALKAWRAKPLLGWGPGNFEVPFNKYYNPQFLKHSFAETVWDKPHNWPLEVLVTSGLLGLGAYLWFYFTIIKFAYNLKPKTYNLILVAGLVAYFVQNLFLFETSNTLLLFFFIAALISSSSTTTPSSTSQQIPNTKYPIPRTRRFASVRGGQNTLSKSITVVLLIFLPVSLYVNFQSLRASYYLQKSETAGFVRQDFNDWSILVRQALQTTEPWGAETAITAADDLHRLDRLDLIRNREDLASAAELIARRLEELTKKYPDNTLYPLWLGRVYVVMGDRLDAKYLEAGEKVLLQARALSPTRQEIYMLLGRLYLIKKDFAKAIEAQRQAVALVPEIGESHWFLGLSLVAAGERQEGLKEIEQAWQLSSGLKTVDNVLYVIDLLAEEKKYDKVLLLYQELNEREPKNPNWYVKLAAIYAVLGNKAEALKAVNQALILAPQIKDTAEKFIRDNKLK